MTAANRPNQAADTAPASLEWDERTGLLRGAPPPAAPPEPPPPERPWERRDEDLLRVALPDLGPITELPPSSGGSRNEALGARRVVLLEPDDELQRVVAKLLIHGNCEVWRAYTWQEARDLLTRQTVDMLITRREAFDDEACADMVSRLEERIQVRVVDSYGDLISGQAIRYDRMARGLLGTLDTLVSLLEQSAGDFTSHAQSVARYARHVARRLGLARREVHAVSVAAYVHELARHLDVSTESDPGAAIARLVRMLRATDLPYAIEPILVHRDAPVDAAGVPVGARVLSVVDAYVHFCAGGTADRTPAEGVAMLRDRAGTRFDSRVVEIFVNVLRSDLVLQRLDRASQTVLMVTPDRSEADLYALRFRNEGYGVAIAATAATAMEEIGRGQVGAVVARNDLRDGDGLWLMSAIRDRRGNAAGPAVFLITARNDSDTTRRALRGGAEDVLAAPVHVEVLVLKVRRALDRLAGGADAARESGGVRGRIEDLGIIEAIQILSSGGRSARIRLDVGERSGSISIDAGRVADARIEGVDPMGEFVEMIGWTTGEFRIDRLAEAVETTIHMPTDGLILEACRRLDETALTDGSVR